MKVNLEQEFAENTTLHGISRVIQATSLLVRIVWSLVFLAASGLFIWILSLRVEEFLRNEVTTLVKVDQKEQLPYPAMTICNFNRFMGNYISPQAQSKLNQLLHVIDQINLDYPDYSDDYDGAYTADEYLQDEFDFESFAVHSGFNLNDSLWRCDWKGKTKSCNFGNFTSVYLPNHGKCYTFNHMKDDHVLTQNLPGSGNGLRIWVDIKQDHYTEPYSSSLREAGLKFIVHNREDPPFIDTLGMSAPPGFHTYVALKQSQFTGLPKPYTKCVTNIPGYSHSKCLIDCKFDFIYKRCDCRPLGYTGDERICSLKESTECVSEAIQEYSSSKRESGECNSQCPHLCNQTTFQTSISMALYPSKKHLTDMLKDPEVLAYTNGAVFQLDVNGQINESAGFKIDPGDHDKISEEIRNNWVLLDIYFDELMVTSYIQVPSITWSAMLSDIGGQMGLFIGCSAITLAEIADYIIKKTFQVVKGNQASDAVVPFDGSGK